MGAFVARQYDRNRDRTIVAQEPAGEPAPKNSDSAAELHQRLEATLLELGKYKALVEASEAAQKRVEAIMAERIAELQRDLSTAQAKAEEASAELARLRTRGFWGRVFEGKS